MKPMNEADFAKKRDEVLQAIIAFDAGDAKRIQHFLADRKVGCIDVDILFCLRKDIQINGFCHGLLVQRTPKPH